MSAGAGAGAVGRSTVREYFNVAFVAKWGNGEGEMRCLLVGGR